MLNLDQAITTLRAENKRLQDQLKQVQIAIATLRGIGSNGGNGTSRRMSAAGRKRISRAQKARWAKWKAQQRKKAA